MYKRPDVTTRNKTLRQRQFSSFAHKGIPKSPAQIAKGVATRKANGSYVPWNKGTAKPKILKGYAAGPRHHNWKGGPKKCIDCDKYVSRASTVKRCFPCCIKLRIGSNNVNWKGGVTPANEKLRKSSAYKIWRHHVFNRDDYTCQACGQKGGDLEVDHELPFSLYPDLRLEVLNGRVLCVDCHRKTETWGRKIYASQDYTVVAKACTP